MDPYLHSSAYQQHMLPVYDEVVIEEVEPTRPTEETITYSYQYSSSSALETPQWPSSSTYKDPSEETPRSAEVPSTYSYPDSSSQILAESSQPANLYTSVYSRPRQFLSLYNLTCTSNHCLYPGCNVKPFKRSADLQRHYRNAHNPDSTKEAYHCDYPRCTRSNEPFSRRDHFRDHLREYHREDIQKRGIVVNKEWLEDRYYSDKWWRCPRCLVRVYTSKDEFECPQCKGSCEPKRKEKRRGH
ncbi:uncharacterized protein NECHADRAFT_75747 [Fusarium vanettenii 77-13-4]|uniref:C2H2-type domain-containing protein n=1 Tax=Fusarium vanettenii (strain ATCC MYA-4622 / CBS 123669 / FGSC 9596 / NRRL 45880 / 77-13-4) TaxID=660122 RepID=C7YJP1_FUSV7|nr:uncharacterized protein NECHADRAFT_75747 [Fusarium vanettenii 77-13-4]EEU49011.1 hypothetical protein NECHADRAFT_75747 [Fusarium vanettenii 77-13-4]